MALYLINSLPHCAITWVWLDSSMELLDVSYNEHKEQGESGVIPIVKNLTSSKFKTHKRNYLIERTISFMTVYKNAYADGERKIYSICFTKGGGLIHLAAPSYSKDGISC